MRGLWFQWLLWLPFPFRLIAIALGGAGIFVARRWYLVTRWRLNRELPQIIPRYQKKPRYSEIRRKR